MDRSFHVQFGPVSVEIQFGQSASRVAEILKYWLGSGLHTCSSPDLVFSLNVHIDGPIAEDNDRLIAGNAWLTQDGPGFWDGRGWECEICRVRSGAHDVPLWTCRPRSGIVLGIARRLPSIIVRLAHQHYFSYQEMLASTLLYRELIPAVQVALLQKDASFIHASAICGGSKSGILVCGWGGSGKTSASAYLYLNHPDDWRYMSDDLAIIGDDGTVYFSPIPLNIFPYNTKQFPALAQAVLGHMTHTERFHWHLRHKLFGPASVARRVPPMQAVNPSSLAKLALVFHVQRTTGNAPRVRECTVAEIAGISKNILAFELRHGLPIYMSANAFVSDNKKSIPSADEVAAASEDVFRKAFAGVCMLSADVPSSYGPREISTLLIEHYGSRVM